MHEKKAEMLTQSEIQSDYYSFKSMSTYSCFKALSILTSLIRLL